MAEVALEMTKVELRNMIENIIEEKLLELLVDNDKGLKLQESLIQRLRIQQQITANGHYGVPMSDVMKQLDL
jgi:hypothetical protein